ncbi:MAG: MFS transporter [Clostridia bacterium]|nr:MFS transporter [Clostridia bacterium]
MSKTIAPGKVGGLEKTGFLGFSCSTNIAYNFKSLYYLTFLTMVLHIPVLTATVMLTIGTVWDAVNDPLIALFCANHSFKNGEKVRPYALWCCVPWAATIILLFVNFHITQSWTIVISVLIYFIFEALYTFLCMPYNTLAALATKDDAERKSINAFRSLGSCIGSGIGSVAIVPMVKLFGGLQDHKIINESDSKALILTAVSMGVICIAGSLFHYFTSKERVVSEPEEKTDKISLVTAYKMLFGCKSWILNMCYIICYGITQALIMQNVNYYASFVLGSSGLATPILAGYLVVAIITSITAPMIDAKLGRKNTMLLAVAVIVIGKLPFIIAPETIVTVIINAVTVGFGSTVAFIMFNTNRNNITDVVAAQNNRRIDTLIAGGDNLISKLAEAAAIQLMGVVLATVGFDSAAEVQNAASVTAIEAFLGWVPAVITLVEILFILKLDIPGELKKAQEKKASAELSGK